ncbi:MAG: hypothetical protein ACHQ50_07510, partial [Fimbriimonadales bacterium]
MLDCNSQLPYKDVIHYLGTLYPPAWVDAGPSAKMNRNAAVWVLMLGRIASGLRERRKPRSMP